MTLGHRHAHRHRQPLTQRAGGAFHAFEQEILRVPGAGATKLAEVADVLDRWARITGEVQQAVDQHRAMPGGQHKAVTVRPLERKSTRLNSSHYCASRMPPSAF